MEIWQEPRIVFTWLFIIILFILVIVILFYLLQQKAIQRLAQAEKEKLVMEMNQKIEIANTLVSIQEEERKRISEIVHDDIGNKLNILSVWLNNPNSWTDTNAQDIILKQIPTLLEATRGVTRTLYPVDLEHFGLIFVLEELANNSNQNLRIYFTNESYNPRSLAVEVQIYRIVQEFINNVIKHANASIIDIHLRELNNHLCLILQDNGRGFKFDEIHKGMGIRNIESRIKTINGNFKWKTAPNKGCRIIIVIPNS